MSACGREHTHDIRESIRRRARAWPPARPVFPSRRALSWCSVRLRQRRRRRPGRRAQSRGCVDSWKPPCPTLSLKVASDYRRRVFYGSGNIHPLSPTLYRVFVHTRSLSDDSSIESVVVDRAMPVIDAVLRRRCRGWAGGRNLFDDLRGEAVLRVLRRLREMSEIGAAIENFEAYVAGITSRVVDDAVRTCSPEWARLKHRVRYLVTHDDRFRFSGERQTVALAHGRGGRVRTAAAEALAARLAEIVTDVEGEMALDDIVSALAGDPKVPEGKTPWSDRS